jgi:hypothetical protein
MQEFQIEVAEMIPSLNTKMDLGHHFQQWDRTTSFIQRLKLVVPLPEQPLLPPVGWFRVGKASDGPPNLVPKRSLTRL